MKTCDAWSSLVIIDTPGAGLIKSQADLGPESPIFVVVMSDCFATPGVLVGFRVSPIGADPPPETRMEISL
jgi:hypothetical protein